MRKLLELNNDLEDLGDVISEAQMEAQRIESELREEDLELIVNGIPLSLSNLAEAVYQAAIYVRIHESHS